MLTTIGFIIGTYTFTRLTSIASRDEKGDNPVVRLFAVIAIFITMILMFGLYQQSTEVTAQAAKQQEELQKLQSTLHN